MTSPDPKLLLDDLKKLLGRVEADLLARASDADVPEIGARLRAEYDRARAAKRTAATFVEWLTDRITQAAVAWVLSCVFARFLEDNDLVSPPRIAGPGDRLDLARGSHQHYFTSHPRHTDRDYLLSIFDELQALPGTADIFGVHNALREIPTWLSGDAAKEVLSFFQRIDPSTGRLIHDFTSPATAGAGPDDSRTRFLGDLYQDLSSFARERYALLQTPHFVEHFLLERTLDPALAEFAATGAELARFRFIDPACGSGHLVLGAFARILDRWQRLEPATPARELVRRTLENVRGVDINPFAVAIARFRVLLVAMRACGITRLADAPAFRIDIECGDSLLHTPLIGGVQELFDKGSKKDADDECDHAYSSEDLTRVKALLTARQYHAVVANPPYITPKDPGLRDRYRKRFATCHMQYSLSVPFMELLYRLCVPGGFTGQITANSFMKREFGSKLIESFFPRVDLTHVIDTSAAYIPGHGTPTVILFGRQRAPVATTVRAVMGIRGEPTTPADPSRGLVWTAITRQVDEPGSESDFVSATDTPRTTFHAHPWSIGGGGASELKDRLEHAATLSLQRTVAEIGFLVITGEDNVLLLPKEVCRRSSVRTYKPLATGDNLRDWGCEPEQVVLWPNNDRGDRLLREAIPEHILFLWPYRKTLRSRLAFSVPVEKKGIPWWCLRELYANRLRTPLSIAFAFVATHNHFVLDRGGKVFKQSAPVIKLPAEATEDDHLSLLGILNSSTACFWMKQVAHRKGGAGIGRGNHDEKWEERFAFNGTGLESFPLPASRPLDLARWAAAAAALPPAPASAAAGPASPASLSTALAAAAAEWQATRCRQIALQEELDWQSYSLYGLLPEPLTSSAPPPPIPLGERAFEIALARRVAAGATTTTWFERHGSTPVTEIRSEWPADYRALVQKRLDAIATLPSIRLIEQPEYKRRWSAEPWAKRQEKAVREFLLDRLERLFDFDGRMNDAATPTAVFDPALVALGELATAARRDPLFVEAAEVLTGDVAFDSLALVTRLVESQSVPLLPVLRYKPAGLAKHAAWQAVWEQQRAEDAIDARTALSPHDPRSLTAAQAEAEKAATVGSIPVPPKYTSADFLKSTFWDLRGKLDVPKERFVSFPGIPGADGTPVIAWAGLDHLQLARAIGNFFGMVQTEYGGTDDPRLVPLLANLAELLPWVKQWHPEVHPDFGAPPAEFFEQFARAEAASRGLTWEQVRGWQGGTVAQRQARRREA